MAIRQSRWAWRLYVIPWIFFWLISLFVDRITFGVLPMILAVATILPAYLRYSKTEYILTHTHLVVRQGEFFSRHRYDIPISEIAELHARPGFLGENLGYVSVRLPLKNGRAAKLDYVPARSRFLEELKARVPGSTQHEDDTRE